MKLVTRAEWKARQPRNRSVGNLNAKSTGHWNGPPVLVGGKNEWAHDVCAGLVRGIQNYHMDGHGWADIAYNFVICPHGYVFEGRGLNVINAANGTNTGNRTSHGIMWLEGQDNAFTDLDRTTFRECVRYVADHTDAPDEAIGHRDHHSTQCPGDARYAWIHQGMPTDTPAPPPPRPSIYAPWPTTAKPIIRRGATGQVVRYLQRVIHDKGGGGISVDGVFGPGTERRVRDLQAFFKLGVDGVVGQKTWGIVDFLAQN